MTIITTVLTSLVILLHLYFMLLEMVLWDKPLGRKVFALDEAFATRSKALAMNQGLYNGFLVAGLIWALLQGMAGVSVLVFFLSCVVIAGVFGAITVNKRIFFVQALPAIIALASLWW